VSTPAGRTTAVELWSHPTDLSRTNHNSPPFNGLRRLHSLHFLAILLRLVRFLQKKKSWCLRQRLSCASSNAVLLRVRLSLEPRCHEFAASQLRWNSRGTEDKAGHRLPSPRAIEACPKLDTLPGLTRTASPGFVEDHGPLHSGPGDTPSGIHTSRVP